MGSLSCVPKHSYSPLDISYGDLPPQPAYWLKPEYLYQDQLPFFVPASLHVSGTGILTRFPSTTPCGLALGTGLPWEDCPVPGNLRLPAGEFLTPLIATHASIISCRSSRVHHHTPSAVATMLLYHPNTPKSIRIHSFGAILKTRYIFRAQTLDQ